MKITTNKGNTVTIPDVLAHYNCVRLHFWNATTSYQVVTDLISKAKEIMLAHTPDLSCDKATNQTTATLSNDIEMFFK